MVSNAGRSRAHGFARTLASRPGVRALTFLFALVPLAIPPAARSALQDKVERRIVTAVDKGTPAAMALLQRAVDINSGTMNFDGVRDVGKLFRAEFETLGFATEWVDGAGWGRAGHLIARRPGRAGSTRLLLIGHLDTVFEPDSPFQRYTRLSDSTATGPGVIDMKGGNVIMLLALRALREAGALNEVSVTAVLTGDEERVGSPFDQARRDLLAAADTADIAMGFEDGDGHPQHAVVARRGSSSWILRVHGTPAHSSLIFRPDIGSGAIYEAARILAAFEDSLSRERYVTANAAMVLGGTTLAFDPEQSRGTAFGKNNVIPETTYVSGDLRTISIPQREAAKATMQRIVANARPHTRATITFNDSYPPLAPSEGNQRLLTMLDRVSRDLGTGPMEAVDPARAGAADVSFCEGRVEMAIDALGMRGDGGHTAGETAELPWLGRQAKRVALLMARVGREAGHAP